MKEKTHTLYLQKDFTNGKKNNATTKAENLVYSLESQVISNSALQSQKVKKYNALPVYSSHELKKPHRI